MAAEIVMPRLSDSMEEGTIVKWLKSVGEEVAVGEELVEIETDKANMVYEADAAGTLLELLAQEGEALAVGATIARVGAAVEPAPARTPAVAASSPTRTKISPLARRIARDRGVDVAAVAGTGPGGRIVKRDVEAVLDGSAPPAPAPADPPPAAARPAGVEPAETAKGSVERLQLSKLQQTVARRMAEAKATAPHFYLQATIDLSAAVAGRRRLKAAASEGERVPSFNDMVVKACALALREHPNANASYVDGVVERYSRVNVGIAVAAEEALVVPTLFDADRKGLRQIAAESRALAARVRDGSITPPELSGGTFTVSNLGMFGVTNFQAVINRPQAGILAVGALAEVPVVRDGELAAAWQMQVSLSCDHRVLYGADGARFLARVRALLEEPIGLAL